jgi:Zn-dependent protease with chaperone function
MFLYAFVALAVVVNVLGYWFSDRLALKASRANPIEPGTNPELEAMVQDLAQRAQVPVPRLYTIPSEQPNAFATGRNPEHAAVAVTDGLLQQLPPEQVKSVLAHEFGHIKNRDNLVSSIAAMVAGAIAAIANLLQFSLLFGGDEEDAGPARLDRSDRDHRSRATRRVAAAARGLHGSVSTSPMRPGLSSSAARDRSRMRSRRSNAALRASHSTSIRRRPRSTSSTR